MTNTTPGLVCGHHHLYSSLARGMPVPGTPQVSFSDILRNIWWRLDAALDLEMIYWSAALGAAEALLSGTTAIIDHHESPNAIEGSLDAIAEACDMVGVRHLLCYGVTDRWSDTGILTEVSPTTPMTRAGELGLQENERYLSSGRRAMVGVHAAFTCGDETLTAAAELAARFGVGVHIHVAEGPEDSTAAERLSRLARPDWLLVHAVHLEGELPGTIVHNPRSNMNNAVGYAHPARWTGPVMLGTDGIGADMLEEFRLSHARHRESDRAADPASSWEWLCQGRSWFPETNNDVVTWSYDHMDDPWRVVFTPGVRCLDVVIDGRTVVRDGHPVTFDMEEIRRKASEQAARLFARLEA